ncbi:MAG: thioredoxin family protein [Chloroflexi bacterium]|nr:thioredoxin family protein [Chloroflexota bacterium]MDA1296743.1 thioredoxin family protein [Chloroflexota bacterium]
MSFTEILNSYSLVIAFPVLLLSMFVLLPIRRWRVRIPLYTTVLVAAVIGFSLLRPGDSTVASTEEANQVLASGQPVFVEFFSNTCTLCLASEPNVKSLTSEIGDRAQVLRLNVQDGLAVPLMREFNAFSTPTFIVFNDLGQEVWRQTGAVLDKGDALAALGLDRSAQTGQTGQAPESERVSSGR